MTDVQRPAQADRSALLRSMERSGYTPLLRALVESCAAPFWWFADATPTTPATIRHNGSICFLHTGQRVIGVTADHVYSKYLSDLEADAVVCQIGGIRFQPERRLISRHAAVDLATFDVPEFIVAGARRQVHHPWQWPTTPLTNSQLVIAGGFPGPLREEQETQAVFPFVSLATRVRQSSSEHAAFQLELANSVWSTDEKLWPGADLGGMSGGPVFRFHGGVEEQRIEHLQLAGFIYEYNSDYEIMRVRQSVQIAPDGTVLPLNLV